MVYEQKEREYGNRFSDSLWEKSLPMSSSLPSMLIWKTNIMPQRHIDEIDFQRAILISLVILVHVVNFGNIHPNIKSGILSFLMPTFLLVTGYLLNVEKPVDKFAMYLMRILLPYVIMVTGYMVLSLYLPVRDGIQQLDWHTVFSVLCIHSIGPYWFFRVMLICSFLCFATFHSLRQQSSNVKLVVYGIVLLCVALFTPIMRWDQAFYFFLGVVLRTTAADYNRLFAPSGLSAAPLLLLLIISPQWNWDNLMVLVMVFCFLSFAPFLRRFCYGRPLKRILYIGRNTLPIYMFHPIFTMAGKFLLPLFPFDSSGIAHAMVVVVIGLAGSLFLAKSLDMLHLSWIFGRPQMLR